MKDNQYNQEARNCLDIRATLNILEGFAHFKRTETGKHLMKMMELLENKMNATKTLLQTNIKDHPEMKQTDDHVVKKEMDII